MVRIYNTQKQFEPVFVIYLLVKGKEIDSAREID